METLYVPVGEPAGISIGLSVVPEIALNGAGPVTV